MQEVYFCTWDLCQCEESEGTLFHRLFPSNINFSQSTAKFYGSESKRHVTVLQDETASLPLRLTGDGVGLYISSNSRS